MRVLLFTFLTFISSWLLWPATVVFAADAYTVEGVEITLPSGLQGARRREAVGKATTQGLNKLLKNLTPHHAWERHEEVIELVDPSRIVEKMVIVEEKPSPRYKLVLNLTFSRDILRKALTDLQIPYSEVAPVQALLLPLLEIGDRRLLWEETNPWREAFKQISADRKNSLMRFTLPVGDTNEMRMLSADMVAYGATDLMGELAKQYNLDQIIVTKAKIVQQFGYNAVDVQSEWHSSDGTATFQLRVPFDENQALEDTLKTAAARVLSGMEEQWRSVSLVEVDKPGRVFLRYDPVDATDLERMKAVVAKMNVVKDIKLRMLSLDNAVFQVNYFGSPEDFMRQLQRKDLQLMKQGNLWHIRFAQTNSDMMHDRPAHY